MPKNKAWGENSKAAEAKARKAEAVKSQKEQKDKAVEDAYWQDDDKNLAKKQNRKDEQEKKRLEKLQRKTESKTLEEEEKESIVSANKAQAIQKITQAQISAEREKREAAARKSTAKANAPPKPAPLIENLNRLQPVEEATTVDEALRILTVSDDSNVAVDRHPERRMKAAFNAYEEARLPMFKAENPSLRLTQLKQLIFEDWKKSPENPMNREEVAYNAK